MNTAPPNHHAIEGRLRRRYEEIWTDIRRELDKHGEQRFSDLVQGAGDPEDDATANLLVDLNLTEIDRDVAELRDVQDAIARLKRGDYGVCESCGQKIAPARLEAVPHAKLCVKCQERAERLNASPGTPSL